MTDFKAWIDAEGIESAEDMLQVYRPVKDRATGWKYELKPAKGTTGNFVVTGGEDNLVLTPKSRDAFIKYMDAQFELGVEGQAAFEHAMEKND